MKALTIAHVNFSDSFGGAASVMNDLIGAQRDDGHNPIRYCARTSFKETGLLGLGCSDRAGLLLKCITKFSTLRNRILGEKYGILAKNYYQKLIEKTPDIFHIHNIHGGWFSLDLLIRLSKHAPIVWTLHDEWIYTGHCVCTLGCSKWQMGCVECPKLDTMVKLWRDTSESNNKFRAMIYQKLNNKSSAAAPVSFWLANRIEKSGIWPHTIERIPNGVNSNVFYPENKQEARNALGIEIDLPVLLCCANGGVNNPFKNMELVSEALGHLPKDKKIVIVFIGDEDKHKTRIENNKTIISTGYVENRDLLRTYYSAGDLLVYPTIADTFGLVPAECMACGTPVLATRVGGITDVVVDGVNGFTIDENISPKMLAAKISKMLDEKKRLKEMGSKGVAHVKSLFSVELMNKKYTELYEKLIGNMMSA